MAASDVAKLSADGATVRPGGRTARVGQAVMKATLDELGEVGLGALSIDAIAQRAGVNRTTIYRRWGDRAGLVATAIIEAQEVAVPIPDTGELRADLVILLKEIRRSLQAPWAVAMISALGSGGERSDVDRVLDALWKERFRLCRPIVERAIERGELRQGLDPHFVIELAIGPMYFRRLLEGRRITNAFIESSVGALLDGIQTKH